MGRRGAEDAEDKENKENKKVFSFFSSLRSLRLKFFQTKFYRTSCCPQTATIKANTTLMSNLKVNISECLFASLPIIPDILVISGTLAAALGATE